MPATLAPDDKATIRAAIAELRSTTGCQDPVAIAQAMAQAFDEQGQHEAAGNWRAVATALERSRRR